jgi:serine/threonine protein kinase
MTGKLILNRYRLLETKGKGGFGTVDVAWDSRLQRRVALKRIPLTVGETDLPGIQEARTAALLNDARIVNVLDFAVTGTEALIIMEYVDGPTLGTVLRESGELLGLDVITTIISDVAGALEYAHENQVLHLDIKPDNILIDHKGHIKVSDFGLSELSGIAGFAEPQGGTIGYMPPEQLIQSDVDARTDLWALAILLYQLLTGKNPFLACSTEESLERIMDDPLPLPSALRPELDPTVDEMLVTALMADRAQRFPSVSAFLAAIAPYLGNTQTGRRQLKYLVNERDLDELEFTDEWHQEEQEQDVEEDADVLIPASVPLWDRIGHRLRGVLTRLVAALACGSFAFVGASGFGLLASANPLALTTLTDLTAQSAQSAQSDALTNALAQSNTSFIILVGVVALIALGAFLVPQLGSALACLALAAGVIARGLIVVGIVLAVLLIAWWLLLGRRGRAETTLVMLTPLLGTLWLAYALPLLAGFFLPWRRAVPTALAQALILIALAAMTGALDLAQTGLVLPPQDGLFPAPLLAFLASPQPWVTLVAFVLAAFVMALFAARDFRWASPLGALFATAVLALPCAAFFLAAPGALWLADLARDGIGLTLSFILLLLLSLLGVSADTAPLPQGDDG